MWGKKEGNGEGGSREKGGDASINSSRGNPLIRPRFSDLAYRVSHTFLPSLSEKVVPGDLLSFHLGQSSTAGAELPSFEEDAGRAEKVEDGGGGPAGARLAVHPPGSPSSGFQQHQELC